MTPNNMAKHRNNPNMPFWKMIKEGNDHFEVTRQEPKVDFCEKKYVFDAIKAPNATREPVFDASAKCPAYAISEEVADAVREKQQAEDAETAKLISRGTPVARINTGIDGGMNKVFAARVPDGNTGLSEGGDGQSLSLLVAVARARHHPLPRQSAARRLRQSPARRAGRAQARCGAAAAPRRARADAGRQRGAGSAAIRRLVLQPRPQGRPWRQPMPTAAPPATPPPREAEGHRSQADRAAAASRSRRAEDVTPKAEPKQAASRPPLKPSVSDTPARSACRRTSDSQVAGSAPIVSSNSFDSRFGAMK